MSNLCSYSNVTNDPKNNCYLLSSWNYGSYSPTNPFYKSYYNFKKSNSKTNINIHPKQKAIFRSTTTAQLSPINTPFYQQNPKRQLKEEDRIVTNEYLDCFNHYNKMQKHLKKGTFRPKSVNRIVNSNAVRENESLSKNGNKKEKKLKSDTCDYKYKLTFTEWLSVKNKQMAFINDIIKKNKKGEEMKEEFNKQVEKKYHEIKEQKYREWLKKKHNELMAKKEKEKENEMKKEEEKKQKEERKEEVMNNWFKIQAKKMEKELLEKREKILMEKEKANLRKIEKQQKQMLNKKAFKEWKERKEKEIKKRKIEEKKKKQREEEKKKRDLLKKRVKSFTIGPYTDAAALKEVQNYLVENNLNKEEEDMYFQNNSEF